jgi:hypothetical protein
MSQTPHSENGLEKNSSEHQLHTSIQLKQLITPLCKTKL